MAALRLRRRADPLLRPGHKLDPPFRVGWKFQDFALLEFPPVIYGHTLYIVDDNGSAKAIDARTGHKLWETKVGTLAAASPALGVAQGLAVRADPLDQRQRGRDAGAGQRQAASRCR